MKKQALLIDIKITGMVDIHTHIGIMMMTITKEMNQIRIGLKVVKPKILQLEKFKTRVIAI